MNKASLALASVVVVATVFATTSARQATAQFKSATVDQYMREVGDDATRASRGFEDSRNQEPETAAATEESSPELYSASALASSSVDATDNESSPLDDSSSLGSHAGTLDGTGDGEVGGETTDTAAANTPSALPDTGGPGAAILLWGSVALASLLPCLGVLCAVVRGDAR